MWPFKKKPKQPATVIHNHAARFVMCAYRDRLIVADNDSGQIREMTINVDGQYEVQNIINF